MKTPLEFLPITVFQSSIIASLLQQSYAALIQAEPQYWSKEIAAWQLFDDQAFANLDTIGRCVFISCCDGQPVGMASFDPRQQPELALVGHNCILPQHRRHGYGRAQILEVLHRCTDRGISRVQVSTGEHPFFLAARKMYMSCGFSESNRLAGRPHPEYGLIEYTQRLFRVNR